ncbi:uncharacterized [Tachysurus ichikawai]
MFTGLKKKRAKKTDTEVKQSICYKPKADEQQAHTQKVFRREITAPNTHVICIHIAGTLDVTVLFRGQTLSSASFQQHRLQTAMHHGTLSH